MKQSREGGPKGPTLRIRQVRRDGCQRIVERVRQASCYITYQPFRERISMTCCTPSRSSSGYHDLCDNNIFCCAVAIAKIQGGQERKGA